MIVESFLQLQLPAIEQPVAKGAALDVGHHVIEESPGFPRVMQRQNMGMGEPGDDLDFLEESLDAEEGGERREAGL